MMTEHEIRESVFLTYFTMLKAVANSTNKDIELLMNKDMKMEFNTMNRVMHKFFLKMKNYMPAERLEEFEEKSFAFIELATLMRDPKHRGKTLILMTMAQEYLNGTAKIIDAENHINDAMPYAYEMEGKLFYPDQLIGQDLSKAKPLYL